jgi:hypothetical protein
MAVPQEGCLLTSEGKSALLFKVKPLGAIGGDEFATATKLQSWEDAQLLKG